MEEGSKDIGVKTSAGIIEPFTDNSIPICIRCEVRLTDENKSFWSDVVKENKTQGVCKGCLTPEEIKVDRSMEHDKKT